MKKNIESYIGISTNSMPGLNIWDAVEECKKAGFKAMEIHLGDFESAIGDPWMIKHAGVWPRTFDEKERIKLKDKLGDFDTVTVHGTPQDVNIAAINTGIREESQKQYREAVQFAADIGAQYVTFHAGHAANSVHLPDDIKKHNIEFMKSILNTVIENNMHTAYERFESYYLEEIPDTHFGLLLDIGHLVMGTPVGAVGPNGIVVPARGNTDTVIEWIENLGKRLIEIHAHNVINWTEIPIRGVAHRPFKEGTCIDLVKVSQKLAAMNYYRPIIFEIALPTAEQVIESCLEDKQTICENYV